MLIRAAAVRGRAPEPITTSDVQEAVEDIVDECQRSADYAIAISTRIYVNKKKKQEKSFSDMMRYKFELSSIETIVEEQLQSICLGHEPKVLKRTAFVRLSSGRGETRFMTSKTLGCRMKYVFRIFLTAFEKSIHAASRR